MSEPLTLGLLGLLALVVLIVLRLPVAYAMILVGGIGTSLLYGPAIFLGQLKTLAWGQFSIYGLSVVPMFVLMGTMATRSGLSADLFRAADVWLGRLRGGMAMAAIAACAGFGAVCGSSLATASTMGRVALPELTRCGYHPRLATGTLAAGGVLGILIPPSVVLVIYAIVVEASIVTLFMAALVPGLLAVLLFVLAIAATIRLDPALAPPGRRPDRAETIAATLGVLPVLAIFGLVVGGMYAGFYNPTPAAAVGVFLVGLMWWYRRRPRLEDLVEALLETARTTGMVYLIVFGAEMLKIFMARTGVPQAAAGWIIEAGLPPLAVILLFLLALILLGCLMDSLSMILLVVPFFWPVLVELNGGPFQGAEGAAFGLATEDLKIWFGIVALIVVELGLITPPVGLNVFVIAALAEGVPMAEVFRGVVPFFLAELLRVALLVAFPGLTLWLPRLLGG